MHAYAYNTRTAGAVVPLWTYHSMYDKTYACMYVHTDVSIEWVEEVGHPHVARIHHQCCHVLTLQRNRAQRYDALVLCSFSSLCVCMCVCMCDMHVEERVVVNIVYQGRLRACIRLHTYPLIYVPAYTHTYTHAYIHTYRSEAGELRV